MSQKWIKCNDSILFVIKHGVHYESQYRTSTLCIYIQPLVTKCELIFDFFLWLHCAKPSSPLTPRWFIVREEILNVGGTKLLSIIYNIKRARIDRDCLSYRTPFEAVQADWYATRPTIATSLGTLLYKDTDVQKGLTGRCSKLNLE